MTIPAYTDKLFTQPQEHYLYPRAEHVYECCWCETFGYHYPATGEVFAYFTCTRPSGHVWVVEGTVGTEGTGRRVFPAEAGITPAEAAKILGATPARLSDWHRPKTAETPGEQS